MDHYLIDVLTVPFAIWFIGWLFFIGYVMDSDEFDKKNDKPVMFAVAIIGLVLWPVFLGSRFAKKSN